MSAVYDAQDERLERPVAVRCWTPTWPRTLPSCAGSSARRRLPPSSATRTWSPFSTKAGRRPAVSRDGTRARRTLRSVIDAGGPMAPADALALLDQILAALAAAPPPGSPTATSSRRMSSSPAGLAKVTDFGLARALADPQASGGGAGTFVGTAAYLAPEQAQTGSGDERSDVYSAGVLLFELVTGQLPFTADTPYAMAHRHVQDSVPAPSSIVPTVPAAVDALVSTATARIPRTAIPTRPIRDRRARGSANAPIRHTRVGDTAGGTRSGRGGHHRGASPAAGVTPTTAPATATATATEVIPARPPSHRHRHPSTTRAPTASDPGPSAPASNRRGAAAGRSSSPSCSCSPRSSAASRGGPAATNWSPCRT